MTVRGRPRHALRRPRRSRGTGDRQDGAIGGGLVAEVLGGAGEVKEDGGDGEDDGVVVGVGGVVAKIAHGLPGVARVSPMCQMISLPSGRGVDVQLSWQ